MTSKLQGKVALVTGAGRGIGRSIALKLASEGASVVVNDLDDAPAEEVVAETRAAGGQAVACPGSVSAPDFAERFVATAMEHYKGLDIIVNNAGYTWDNVIQKMTDEQWHAMIDVHLTAPFRILRAAQPAIRALSKADAEAGRRNVRKVVNISSVAGLFGNPGQANYSAAKAGVAADTVVWAKELARYGIRVAAIAPGFIETEMTAATAERVGMSFEDFKAAAASQIPVARTGKPDDIAHTASFLASEGAGFVSGQVIYVAGGPKD